MKNWFKENSIAFIALVVSIIAASFTYIQCDITRKQARLHIEPDIRTYFKGPEDMYPGFIISNEGDIPVVSVTVGNRGFFF